ncbi:MAG: hypothetical protein ACI38U_12870 [Corynebacterium sp.]|uniref:hypothetical protein n=1 Tax=Corynebacterium sp. TaxID=1720 RepID=UPI003F088B73
MSQYSHFASMTAADPAGGQFWSSVLSGTVSGVVAGLIVAGALACVRHRNRPTVEAIATSENRATLRNNGFRALVVGGSRAYHDGNFLSAIDLSGRTSGIMLPGRDSVVLRIERLEIGAGFQLSVRRIALWRTIVNRLPDDYHQWSVDPIELDDPGSTKRHEGWTNIELTLKSM